MKPKAAPILALIGLVLSLVTSVHGAAPRYQLINLGSLGGTNYYETFTGVTGRLINSSGTVAAGMDTAVPDPFCFNAPKCLTSHAFQWSNGSLTDLGTLEPNAKGNFSQAFSVNDQGHSAGVSTYNALGSSGEPLLKAVTWKDGQIVDLGTLGGNQSFAQAINNRDQVIGCALNTVPASTNIFEDYPFPFGTQLRAFLWENGAMRDIGTLGGPSAWPTYINENGQIIGQSYTAVETGPSRHVGEWAYSRPIAGFIWDKGTMTDLGSLGGTWALPMRINNQGQVVGYMTIKNETAYHPFLWDKGVLKDLGTFGGGNGQANDINDAGEVVGGANGPSGFHAFLWKDGVKKDLGTLDNSSLAWYVNSKTQVVGASGTTQPNIRAFLWENGGPMLDLNKLVPAGSPKLTVAIGINERGEILCGGKNEQGLFLLVPAPQLAIHVSSSGGARTTVMEMKVIPGKSYALETSSNLQTWTQVESPFIAQIDTVTRQFQASDAGHYYRLGLLP